MVLSWSRQQLFIFSLLLLLFMSYQLLNRFLKLQVFVRVTRVVKKNNRQLSYKTITTKVNTTKLYHKLRKLTTTLLQNQIRTASTHYILNTVSCAQMLVVGASSILILLQIFKSIIFMDLPFLSTTKHSKPIRSQNNIYR